MERVLKPCLEERKHRDRNSFQKSLFSELLQRKALSQLTMVAKIAQNAYSKIPYFKPSFTFIL